MANFESDPLIAGLVDDLTPVRAHKAAIGWLLMAGATLATALVVIAWNGLIAHASPLFMLANGLFLLLGIAAGASAVAMASPRVGAHHDGPRWAMAMASVLPLAAIVLLPRDTAALLSAIGPTDGWRCAVVSAGCSVLIALVLTLWLRRGAPVSPEISGLFAGAGAGALGTVAYGLTCPVDDVYHLGLCRDGEGQDQGR